jgi:hypothetical protein
MNDYDLRYGAKADRRLFKDSCDYLHDPRRDVIGSNYQAVQFDTRVSLPVDIV